MRDEVLEWLGLRSDGLICDGTLGLAGHASAILERSAPGGRLIGLDRDAANLARARERLAPFGGRVATIHTPFSQAKRVLGELGWGLLDGFLLDLGVSSTQLDQAERGFSFQGDGPLDMRMDPSTG
jgi:16S rRNA (cytosine1402-N4)-methyltransferase